MKAIISAYAIRPYSGSEPGLGWHWIKNLANELDKILVITESEFAEEIIEWQREEGIENIEFLFISIGKLGRSLCWNQGNYLFYFFYRFWQIRALLILMCKDLKEFDFIHHLNMIGYREPGLLHLLNLPFILGPLGGLNTVPNGFFRGLSRSEQIKARFKKSLNFLSLRLPYVKLALFNSRLVISANSESYEKLREIGINSILINETGLEPNNNSLRKKNEKRILWVGKMVNRKLPFLALDIFTDLIAEGEDLTISFLGDGPLLNDLKEKVAYRGLNSRVQILGQVDHSTVLKYMQSSFCLLFTSIDEGTPHVVLEALACGLNVFVHDSCGMRDVIEDSNFKVKPIDYDTSRKVFGKKIREFKLNFRNRSIPKTDKFSWQYKIKEFISHVNAALR